VKRPEKSQEGGAMIRAAMYGAGRSKLIYALENEQEFKTSGSLSGVKDIETFGQLNEKEIKLLKQDWYTVGVRYYVVSYKTPIAWVRNDGKIHRVNQKFSITTTKHQGMLYNLGRAVQK
jgi:hypothetical protein